MIFAGECDPLRCSTQRFFLLSICLLHFVIHIFRISNSLSEITSIHWQHWHYLDWYQLNDSEYLCACWFAIICIEIELQSADNMCNRSIIQFCSINCARIQVQWLTTKCNHGKRQQPYVQRYCKQKHEKKKNKWHFQYIIIYLI